MLGGRDAGGIFGVRDDRGVLRRRDAGGKGKRAAGKMVEVRDTGEFLRGRDEEEKS